MPMHYSDPSREQDPHALPDVEVWQLTERDVEGIEGGLEVGKWYYWFRFPECLPDSEPFGPFETEEEALANAREDILEPDHWG